MEIGEQKERVDEDRRKSGVGDDRAAAQVGEFEGKELERAEARSASCPSRSIACISSRVTQLVPIWNFKLTYSRGGEDMTNDDEATADRLTDERHRS